MCRLEYKKRRQAEGASKEEIDTEMGEMKQKEEELDSSNKGIAPFSTSFPPFLFHFVLFLCLILSLFISLFLQLFSSFRRNNIFKT